MGLAGIIRYARTHYYELPANILEGITLVLVVVVQDLAFKESLIVCAALLLLSLGLHGLAYRAGQCQVWPKVIELSSPVPFLAMLPSAYLATTVTQRTAFITINFWFVAVEVACILAGRNFMAEYLQDWNPKEVWGTPLLQRGAAVTAAIWVVCQVIMGVAQVLAVVFNLSMDSGSGGNVGLAVFVCYIMQLIPLLVAIVCSFAYPSYLKRRWGYVKGVRATCYPPPAHGIKSAQLITGGPAASCSSSSSCGGSSSGRPRGSQPSMESSCRSGVSAEDVVVCISPRASGSKPDKPVASTAGSRGSSADGDSGSGSDADETVEWRQQQ